SRPRRTVPDMADHDPSAPTADPTAPTDRTDPTDLTADVVVLGGGPVGENVAQYAIEGTDLTAVVVEGELLGGECSYYACIPSKALLRPPAVADTAAHLPGITTPQVDRDALLLRRDAWVSHYDDSGQGEWAEGAGIQVVRGHGRIVGEREVLVEAADATEGADGAEGSGGAGDAAARTRIRARRAVVIATGSRAHVPGPLRELLPWTARDVTGVREVPGELVIVGGGVVAVEAATWMAALGAQVRLLVRGSSLLTGYEPFAAVHV